MDKLKTRILLISLLLLLLFSVQSVAAVSDDDGNLTSESIDLSICDNTDDINSDKPSNNQGDVLSTSNELDVLGAYEHTFSELADEIRNGGNTVVLKYDYYIYDGSTSAININGDNRIIDGNGTVIDMVGSTIRAFNVGGSGVTIKNLTIKNANFNGDGGAIDFEGTGTVTNCNFTGNKATGSNSWGGAVYFSGKGNVTNCNFTNNKAEYYGGAVYFNRNGNVTNCNFVNNTASDRGGAVCFMSNAEVTNCNFTNNTASRDGGAIRISSGSVENCNFTANQASVDGGAVYFWDDGTVTNCNFTNNNAEVYGGAVYFDEEGTVTNCNFTGNNATTGSAIYFWSTSATKTVSNSCFLNNRANAETLEVTKNDNNITITFTGNDNLLNAIYSRNDAEVTFSNVTYWSANGIAKTGSSAIKPSRSNKEAGQNITVSILVNDKIVLNKVYITDENGMIVLDIKVGENYYIGVRHDTDSYYTEKVNTTSNNTKFHVNVTSQTTNNKTVNITAKSNIPDEVIKGKLLFILPNSTEISANYGGNGTWWAVHTFDDYRVYEINTSYTGLDNVTVNNGTVTISKANSTISAENKTVTYPNDIVLVTIGENCTGINKSSVVIRNPDGTTADANVNVDGFTITISGLGAGNYTVYYNNTVNSDWNGAGNFTGITVLKANSTVKADDIEVIYGDSIVVIVTSENATGVSYKVIGKDGVVKEGTLNVKENITGLDLAAGQYTVNLTTMVNVNYSSSNYTSKITVKPANSTVKAEDVEVTYGDSIEVVVTSENATKVSYQIISSGTVVKEGTINVNEKITGLDLAAGEYTVNLTTMVNCNYTSSNYTSKITVKPANSTIKAEDVEVTYGDSIVVVVDSENATGVSYKVIGKDGIVKEGTVNVNENITGLDLAAGQYTVNLTTMVNSNYTSSNYTSKITVKPANSTISADDVEVTYGETVTIQVSVVNVSEFYYAIVNENGTTVDSDIIQAGLNITVENLSAGKYNVTLITGVDSNHTSVTNASKITVNPAGSSVSAKDAVASFGDTVSINVSSENATEISYSIIDAKGNAVANGTVKPGEAIGVSDLDAGDYTVILTTVVDTNHSSVSNSSKLHIKHVVTITIAPVTGHAGEVISFTAQFKYENGDPVSEGTAGLTIRYEERELLAVSMYSILSADESSPVSNGEATFNVKLGVPGKYPYVISYSGGDADDVEAESELTVLKVNTTVSVVDVSGKPADKKDVTVTVLDQDNNPVTNGTVTLTLNGETYNATVDNGKAVISVELPNPGEYNATVTYNGNGYYNSSSSSIAVDVEKVNTNSPSAEEVSGKAGEKTDITVKFSDENGNPVKNGTATLTIDGKTYTAEVVDGAATFKDVVLPEKDTVADVYYQGNDYYNASSTTISIKVKQNNTEPDNNGTDENKTTKHVSSKIIDANATGNPIAVMLLALCVLVITYRKR